jgi:hypothetical protein
MVRVEAGEGVSTQLSHFGLSPALNSSRSGWLPLRARAECLSLTNNVDVLLEVNVHFVINTATRRRC